jgi:hypothetical protein
MIIRWSHLVSASEDNVRRLAAFLNVDPTLDRDTLINVVEAAMWMQAEEPQCHGDVSTAAPTRRAGASSPAPAAPSV